MSYTRFRLFFLFPLLCVAAGAAFAVLILPDDRVTAILMLAVFGLLAVMYVLWAAICRRDLSRLLLQITAKLDMSKKKSLSSFPLPVAVTDEEGKLLLYNDLFDTHILRGADYEKGDLGRLLPGIITDDFPPDGVSISCGDRCYTAYYDETVQKDKRKRIFYFIDDTELKHTAIEYERSRPQVLFLSFDGLNEIQKNYSSNDFGEIRMLLDRIVANWASGFGAVYDKLSADQYVVIAERRDVDTMKSNRFRILNEVRALRFHDRHVGVTLSIGVGSGETYSVCETFARQALDMAQSRGGDQAAVREQDGSYSFFGGVAKGIEKTNKVRTRIVASSVAELIRSSKNVMLMGHRFPDLDAMGAAVAMASASLAMGVNAYIVTDQQKSLAKPLLERMREEGFASCLLAPHEALAKMGKDTLLIVVDTHIAAFTEVPQLLEKAQRTVVIDHHRKSVQFIENAVLFFHDPGASSACEMVTELLQYLTPEPVIGPFEADALLSGITLDTRSFVLRAGVRTFEAAAYLKSRGADTVRVKKMFASTLENQKMRGEILSASQNYRGCAIASTDLRAPDVRIIASQAADELLNISDVDASFVLFETADCINISARSLGQINVQVVMERLGGGGHQTMAAAQLANVDMDEALRQLHGAIDEYFENVST